MTSKVLIIVLLSLTVYGCAKQAEKLEANHPKNVMDQETYQTIESRLNKLDSDCGNYKYYRIQTETNSKISYIYLSESFCLDKAFLVIVDKKTRKVIKIEPANMA